MQRETQGGASLNQWKGINQRTQPTLVQDGFFTEGRGVFFGLGDNAERIPGKRLSGQLDRSIFSITPFQGLLFIQGYDTLSLIPKEEVSDFFVTFTPDTPAAPSISLVSFFTLTVTMPVLATYATAQNLQQSLDGVTWTTIASGLASLQVIPITGLTDNTLYYYRAVATNPYTSASGIVASATTLMVPLGTIEDEDGFVIQDEDNLDIEAN